MRPPSRTILALAGLVGLLALVGPGPLAAVPVPGEALVRFEGDAGAGARADALDDAGAHLERRLPIPGAALLDLESGVTVAEAVRELRRDPAVRWAEPNHRVRADALPDDALLDQLWGLRNTGQGVLGRGGTPGADIDAETAWDRSTGSDDVIVGVVDTGVDLSHPDLAARIAPGGLDVVDPGSPPADENGHGTHVAGTIAARGNDGAGVTGVAWRARILPVRVLDADGAGNAADTALGLGHAARQGARIVNASLGGPRSQAIADAIAAYPDTLFVVSAGNSALNLDAASAAQLPYPCAAPSANVVCVGASDRNDALASFSNFGATHVDLAAPGVDVLSTSPFGSLTRERFDAGLPASWTTGGAGPWTAAVDPATGSGAVASGPLAAGEESWLASPAVDLTGLEACTVLYALRHDAEPAGALRVEFSAGGGWIEVVERSQRPRPGPWRELQADVPGFLGDVSATRVRFRLVPPGAVAGGTTAVDDVRFACLDVSPGAEDTRILNGTSMAAPHVAGAAALALAARPGAGVADLRAALLGGVDRLASLGGLTTTGGRLNASRMLDLVTARAAATPTGAPSSPSPPVDPPPPRVGVPPATSSVPVRTASPRPRLSGLRLTRTAVRLRLAQPVRVRVTVERLVRELARGGRRGSPGARRTRAVRVRTLAPRSLRAGPAALVVRRLAAGRYRVTVRMTDRAGRTASVVRSFPVR